MQCNNHNAYENNHTITKQLADQEWMIVGEHEADALKTNAAQREMDLEDLLVAERLRRRGHLYRVPAVLLIDPE